MKSATLSSIRRKLATAGLMLASTVFGTGGGCDGGAASLATSETTRSVTDFSGFGAADFGAAGGLPIQR